MKTVKALVLFTGLLLLLKPLHASTVALSASGDTWMVADFPDNNMGDADDFAAGVNSHSNPARALIKFDLSSVPANATVTSVTLSLTATKQSLAANATFALHRLLVDWGEGVGVGSSGSLANTDEATWNARLFSDANWSTPGAAAPTDFTSTESGTIAVSGLGQYTVGSTATMVADVQAWISGSANNYGWIFYDKNEGTSNTIRRWASRNVAGGPTLTVTYTAPATAASPVISEVTVTNNQFRFSFSAESNRTYAVEAANVLSTNSWTVLTNFSASLVATNFVVIDSFAATNKFYRVRTP